MANAPVCHVSTDEKINQPPAKQLPAIPQATDLNSALAAINAMRQILQAMLGRSGSSGGLPRPGSAGPTQGLATRNQQQAGRWREVNRATKEIKIPIDDSSDPPTVTIKRTNSITMQDTVTGEILTLRG